MKDFLSGFPPGGSGGSGITGDPDQIIPAGAFTPLSTNTNKVFSSIELTGGDDLVFNCISYPLGTSDQWHVSTLPPAGWTSGKLKFIAHYIVIDNISIPGNYIWDLGCEFLPDEFNLDSAAFQVISTPADVAPGSVEPYYFITAQSAELTLTGSPTDAGAIALRLKRGSDTESDPAYFVKLKLSFV